MKATVRSLKTIVVISMMAFLFAGCGNHMKKVNVVNLGAENVYNSTEFVPYRIFKLRMPDVQDVSEGSYGSNHFVVLQRSGAEGEKILDIEKSGEFLKANIFTESNGYAYLFLYDIGNKIDTSRKVLINSRVVPGHQFSVDEQIICGSYMQHFNWNLFKSIDEYIEEGFIEVIDVDNSDSTEHKDSLKRIASFFEYCKKFEDPTDFERFLKSLGIFTSGEISIFIAATFDPTRVYPVIGAKLFDILKVLSGQVDLNEPYYETRIVRGFDLGLALKNYGNKIRVRIRNESAFLNAKVNLETLAEAKKALTFWRLVSEEETFLLVQSMARKSRANSKKSRKIFVERDLRMATILRIYDRKLKYLDQKVAENENAIVMLKEAGYNFN